MPTHATSDEDLLLSSDPEDFGRFYDRHVDLLLGWFHRRVRNADVAAVHCLSETLGGRWNIPHGLANAVLLAPVTRYNFDACADKLATLDATLDATLPPGCTEGFLPALDDLLRDLNIPHFRDLGIPADTYPWIAERAAQNGSNSSNAREMGAAEYLEILNGL